MKKNFRISPRLFRDFQSFFSFFLFSNFIHEFSFTQRLLMARWYFSAILASEEEVFTISSCDDCTMMLMWGARRRPETTTTVWTMREFFVFFFRMTNWRNISSVSWVCGKLKNLLVFIRHVCFLKVFHIVFIAHSVTLSLQSTATSKIILLTINHSFSSSASSSKLSRPTEDCANRRFKLSQVSETTQDSFFMTYGTCTSCWMCSQLLPIPTTIWKTLSLAGKECDKKCEFRWVNFYLTIDGNVSCHVTGSRLA